MAATTFGFIRVAAVAPRTSIADAAANTGEILGFVDRALRGSSHIVTFPELSLTGYTSGDLFFGPVLTRDAERGLTRILDETRQSSALIALGLPIQVDGRLFNAAAVLQAGRILGVVPKTYLPSYKEYYEKRWFAGAREATTETVHIAGQDAPFGTDILFTVPGEPGMTLAVEICEDLWAPIPPSSRHAVAGATVILNLSASNEIVGKADYRRELVRQQSARTLSAYVYASCGVHESTTDVVYGGHLLVAENGTILAESERFRLAGDMIAADVDVERLLVERTRQTSFADSIHEVQRPYRRVVADPIPVTASRLLLRTVDPHPFVPQDPDTRDQRCQEIFSIQTAGLAKRVAHIGIKRVMLGLSGGLDSTLALLVAGRTFDLLELPRSGILAVTMPGFGTTARTLGNARRLAEAVGAELREIDIRAACQQHIKDIGLSAEDRESVTYQNLQARERTQILMDLANLEGGIVVGTGDLSELALGFATFAGDHIAMYNVNSGVPKTLVRALVRWVAEHRALAAEREVLLDVLETPVSPELLPPAADDSIAQVTEEIIGPYELHDFFLFGLVRLGAGPRKILFLAEHAFGGRYDRTTLRRWLGVFVNRFFDQQFKRSVMPDGPKVGSVALSPRGDWRMPSDASKAAWLRELEGAEVGAKVARPRPVLGKARGPGKAASPTASAAGRRRR